MSRRLCEPQPVNDSRRRLLRQGLAASGVIAAGPLLWSCGGSPRPAVSVDARTRHSNIPDLAGRMQEVTVTNAPDTRMRIPRGFSVREVARTGVAGAGAGYAWHPDPDGGAVFAMPDGGWVYVSNSEVGQPRQGGVGALRFSADGDIVDSYAICTGTTNNCAGGPTPWGTWLSCEETETGLVHECDPTGRHAAVTVPALGLFKHEAAAVDPVGRRLYLTEDIEDGNFYRFTPDQFPRGGRAELRRGTLEVAVATGDDPLQTRPLTWKKIANPLPAVEPGQPDRGETPTRHQVRDATVFNGGEGCWYHDGVVYFTTKGDNRVWAVDTRADTIDLVYDKASEQAFNPGIDDVDNVTVSAGGDVIVAEDGAEMRLVVVGPDAAPFELVNVLGQRQSEITGPAFSPDGSRLYFSSQRGPAGTSDDGRTYELRGPFFSDRA